MIKRMFIMLCLVGLVFAGLFGFQRFKGSIIKSVLAKLADPVQTVATAQATASDWQTTIRGIGTFRAVKGADLALETGGIVSEIDFASGDDVVAGKTLLQLRPDDDIGKLAALEATAELNAINLKRDQEQFKFKAVSQATLDSDGATLRTAQAQVAQQKAIIAEKTLVAPFAGRLGIRSVDLGQYLSPGTVIVTLQALDPIFIDFYLPQQALSEIHVGQAAKVGVDTYPGMVFPGEISAINSKVETASRNVQIRVSLKNPDLKLMPGMYGTVDIDAGAPQKYVTLPSTAITNNSYGETVFVVEKKGDAPDLTARQVFVKTAGWRGDQVAVASGVKEGDTVVVAGQIKLHNGAKISVDNAVLPSDNPAPAVANY